MKAPCYVCGADAEVEGLCTKCYNEAHPLIQVDTPLSIQVCKRCGAVKVPGGWRAIDEHYQDKVELRGIQVSILLSQEVSYLHPNVRLEIHEDKTLDRVLHLTLIAQGRSHPSLPEHQEEFPVEIRFNHGNCDTCGMMSGGYHEAVIQIRTDERELTDQEAEEIAKTVTDRTIAEYGKDVKAYVTEISQDRHGLDFKIGSEHLAQRIADQIESQYLAERKENYKLIGQEKGGKEKYRITILLRLPRFRTGDFIKVLGNPCEITSMGKGGLGCYDLAEQTSFTINPKSSKWRTIEFLGPRNERRQYTIIAQGYDQPFQLMDNSSYQTIEVDRDRFVEDVEVGDTVYLLEVDGRIFVVPTPGQD
jgi:nonsense-mediated mRNA decay protein 3